MDELSARPERTAEAHPQVLHARLSKVERALVRLEDRLFRLENELQAQKGERQLKKAASTFAAEEVRRLRKQVARLLQRVEALEGASQPMVKAQGAGGALDAQSFDRLVDEVGLEATRKGATVQDAFAKAGHLRLLYAHDPRRATQELLAWKAAVEGRRADTPLAARGLGEV